MGRISISGGSRCFTSRLSSSSLMDTRWAECLAIPKAGSQSYPLFQRVLALLGISHSAYLADKALPHSK